MNFCFNEFAFIVQVKHKINSTQILGFIFWYVSILRLAISIHVYFAENVAYFHFNSWLSFQRLCRLLWGCYWVTTLPRTQDQFDVWFPTCSICQTFGRWNSPQGLQGCHQPRRLEDRVQNLNLQTAVWFLATRCGGRTLRSCLTAWQTVSGIGGDLDEESSVISIHKVTEWWAAYVDAGPYSHMVISSLLQTEKCWGKDAALTDTWCRFEACRFVFPDTNCCSWRAAIKSVSTSGIPLLRSAFHSARRSTESKAALMSRYATFKGPLNSQWISESKRRARMASMVDLPLVKGDCWSLRVLSRSGYMRAKITWAKTFQEMTGVWWDGSRSTQILGLCPFRVWQ